MSPRTCLATGLGLSFLLNFPVGAAEPAAEPSIEASQLPRIPPTPPERAVSTFRVKPGFRIELAAAEPLVVDPIALSFDEDGRLYVVEMRDYSERRPERLGRIRRLEDRNGDGRFDRSTVFAQDLPWPTAVFCYGGGVFVGSTPYIWWMRDTNGDGVADEREIIFTGFAADFAPFATNKLNVQALMNSFNWSLDNRIHGATSFSGGKVRRVDSPFVRNWQRNGGPGRAGKTASTTPPASGAPTASSASLDLRGRDFSFDPRALEMRAESGGGQHGLSFDDDGRKFVCANSSHLQTLRYEERYAAFNPGFTMPQALVEIAADGGAAPVFRLSPDEPWRVIRTQWRVAGLVKGPIEGGGRPSGYFTGATGVTIYRGDAYGEAFVGDAFVGDAGSNLVHRKRIQPEGPGVAGRWQSLTAVRPEDEQRVEFLASTDNWFRPVQFANAPDGCLYICDMYREVIEHPWSLPQSIKQHLDLNSGNDRGRIYRIVPDRFKQPSLPRLSRAGPGKLVKTLELANGWHRDTAARLLYERQDRSAAPPLQKLAATSPVTKIRVHALHALAGLGRLETPEVLRGLTDPSPDVRRHALRLSEDLLQRAGNAEVLGPRLLAMAGDADERVREQLGFTVRFLPREARARTAAAMLRSRPLWDREYALLSSISNEAWDTFRALALLDPTLSASGATGLARNIGERHDSTEVTGVIEAVVTALPQAKEHTLWPNIEVASALAGGVLHAGRSLAEFDAGRRLAPVYEVARRLALTEEETVRRFSNGSDPRHNAFTVLGAAGYDDGAPTLMDAIERQPMNVAPAATALGRHTNPQLASDLLRRWPRFTPSARPTILALLLKRPERIQTLLAALETGIVQTSDLTASHQAQLREYRDAGIREKAVRVLGKAPDATRQSVVAAFTGALELKGSSAAGQKTFQARCATCHKLGRDGYALGPDLVTVRNGGKEKLLTNIVDPNREMNGNFVSYAMETKDGESLVGIIAGENASSVTVRMPGGIETVVARGRIASLQSLGRSLMPESLEEGLSVQDMADLLEFIQAGP